MTAADAILRGAVVRRLLETEGREPALPGAVPDDTDGGLSPMIGGRWVRHEPSEGWPTTWTMAKRISTSSGDLLLYLFADVGTNLHRMPGVGWTVSFELINAVTAKSGTTMGGINRMFRHPISVRTRPDMAMAGSVDGSGEGAAAVTRLEELSEVVGRPEWMWIAGDHRGFYRVPLYRKFMKSLLSGLAASLVLKVRRVQRTPTGSREYHDSHQGVYHFLSVTHHPEVPDDAD